MEGFTQGVVFPLFFFLAPYVYAKRRLHFQPFSATPLFPIRSQGIMLHPFHITVETKVNKHSQSYCSPILVDVHFQQWAHLYCYGNVIEGKHCQQTIRTLGFRAEC